MSENKIPEKIKDKELYKLVKQEIIKLYPKHSAYRSMMIIKQYKNLGGKFNKSKEYGINRWLDEEWINVYAYLKDNKIIKCGDKKYIDKSACRPLKIVNDKTPITLPELLEIHTPEEILKAIKIKNKDPQNRILRWKDLKIINKNK